MGIGADPENDRLVLEAIRLPETINQMPSELAGVAKSEE